MFDADGVVSEKNFTGTCSSVNVFRGRPRLLSRKAGDSSNSLFHCALNVIQWVVHYNRASLHVQACLFTGCFWTALGGIDVTVV